MGLRDKPEMGGIFGDLVAGDSRINAGGGIQIEPNPQSRGPSSRETRGQRPIAGCLPSFR